MVGKRQYIRQLWKPEKPKQELKGSSSQPHGYWNGGGELPAVSLKFIQLLTVTVLKVECTRASLVVTKTFPVK